MPQIKTFSALQSCTGPVQGQNRVFPVKFSTQEKTCFHYREPLFSLQGSCVHYRDVHVKITTQAYHSSLHKFSLHFNLHFRHCFLQIISHFLLKLKLKMKAENKGEIKLGKTENKWICRKNCGCKPRVHICTLVNIYFLPSKLYGSSKSMFLAKNQM